MKLYLIFTLFLIVQVILGKVHLTNKNEMTYKAGVVEFHVRMNMTAQQKIDENVEHVIEIINSVETKDVDILVFPEGILNDATVPIPLSESDEGHSLCDLPTIHWVLRDISCAAKQSGTYISIDLVTKDNNTGAAYNTALVFDRFGSIIAKYRKYNLHGESGVQSPPKPDVTTFMTDFNATFGIFICFDLLFEDPAITLVNKGIKNFVYPAMWIAELPYLTAVQIQQGWAYANGVNLLAANANRLETATFGSGIYVGRRGSSTSFVATESTTKVIKADVPVDPSPIDQIPEDNSNEPVEAVIDTEYNLWKENMSGFTIKFLNTSEVQSGEIQSNGIRCKYNVSITDLGEEKNKKTYYYAVATFNGYRSYASNTNTRTAQRICSIIACTKLNDRESCGQRHSSSAEMHKRFRFNQLDLSLSTDLQMSNMKIIPNTLAMNLKPLQRFILFDSAIGNVLMKLQVSAMDILTFSIYGRDYQHDILDNQQTQISHGNVYKKLRAHCCCCFQ